MTSRVHCSVQWHRMITVKFQLYCILSQLIYLHDVGLSEEISLQSLAKHSKGWCIFEVSREVCYNIDTGCCLKLDKLNFWLYLPRLPAFLKAFIIITAVPYRKLFINCDKAKYINLNMHSDWMLIACLPPQSAYLDTNMRKRYVWYCAISRDLVQSLLSQDICCWRV